MQPWKIAKSNRHEVKSCADSWSQSKIAALTRPVILPVFWKMCKDCVVGLHLSTHFDRLGQGAMPASDWLILRNLKVSCLVNQQRRIFTFFNKIMRRHTVSRIHQLPSRGVIQYNSMAVPCMEYRNNLKIAQIQRIQNFLNLAVHLIIFYLTKRQKSDW